MRRLMRGAALLSVVLAATLALAACGGSKQTTSTSVPAQSLSPTAYSRTAFTKTGTTTLHVTFSGSVKTSGQSIGLSGSGDFDSAARTGTMDISITLGTQHLPLTEVLDGENVYVSSSLLSSFLPSGKTWLKASVASAAKTLGPSSFALTSPGTLPALKNVRKIGSATVDGTQTTEYRGVLDASKLPKAARAALGKGKVTFRPVDVWIGSDGYVHRARIALSSGAGGTQADVVLTTTLSKFGEKVSVKVPPASETVDASTLNLSGLGGLGI